MPSPQKKRDDTEELTNPSNKVHADCATYEEYQQPGFNLIDVEHKGNHLTEKNASLDLQKQVTDHKRSAEHWNQAYDNLMVDYQKLLLVFLSSFSYSTNSNVTVRTSLSSKRNASSYVPAMRRFSSQTQDWRPDIRKHISADFVVLRRAELAHLRSEAKRVVALETANEELEIMKETLDAKNAALASEILELTQSTKQSEDLQTAQTELISLEAEGWKLELTVLSLQAALEQQNGFYVQNEHANRLQEGRRLEATVLRFEAVPRSAPNYMIRYPSICCTSSLLNIE
ncbi:hypothetical protein C8R43DRAFT_950551 [Mycena crocata]|nr:hypothetical protein C8R43DRAFT_950551 [Mycena crocata]